ncbi:transposase [Streptomyces sp. NPDC058676]|uniref:transposase n=1 Tax=unclassified Streptomyces TaxID=2593676 RepID=UPI0036652234
MLEPLLPIAQVGRPSACRRRLIDGIRWRVRTGAPWRDLPGQYGPWQTVYGLFRRWQRTGVWAAVLSGLQARADAGGLITWEVNVDSAGLTSTRPAPAGTGRPRRSHPAGSSPSRTIAHSAGLEAA